eukprot:SM000100S09380  [mRNA]  locus=s100:79567:80770:+ [translate_table: standard]
MRALSIRRRTLASCCTPGGQLGRILHARKLQNLHLSPPYILRQAAEAANMTAMVVLAEEYQTRGDCTKAMEWLRRAARQGHQGCQIKVAEAYYRGEETCPRDGEEALVWLLRAARNPDATRALSAKAAVLLGFMYLDGEGTHRPDNTEAVRWFQLASKLGNLDAEQIVGWLWNTGQY